MQQDVDTKHTAKTTWVFVRGKKQMVLDWPCQSPDLKPLVSIEEYKGSVTSVGHGLDLQVNTDSV